MSPQVNAVVKTKTHGSRRTAAWRIAIAMVLLMACLLGSGLLVDVGLWRANVCLEARNHSQALAWLRSVAWMRPRSPELHFLLARTYRRLGRFPDVEAQLALAAQLGWPRSAVEREQWLAQAQTGQFAALRDRWGDLFENAGSDGPEICRAFVIAALKRFEIGSATRVIALWKSEFPDDGEPYFQEARIAAVSLRWKDAEQACREALRRAPERRDVRESLIEACMKQLNFAAADVELKQLLQRDPENVTAQVHRADCMIRLGSLDEARKLLKSILERHPDHRETLVLFGQLELADGRAQDAVTALRNADAQHSEDAELRYLLGKALRASGHDDEAAEHIRYREQAREPLMRLSEATTALVAAPNNESLRYEVGELTWRWKSHDDGAYWLLSLLEFNPSHVGAHALLAHHYQLKGDAEREAVHRKLAGTSEFVE